MNLQIHNSLSGEKEPFTPLDPNRVSLYVCGPTVYNRIHIGNARPVVIFDTLFRLLQQQYPKVVYARNITDVDDKINQAAQTQGVDISVIASRYTQAFHEDIAQLNTLPPTIEPRATEHIGAIIDMCQALIDRGHAYVSADHVLFHVPSMPDYGKLSKRSQEDMLAGARVEVADYKKDPADFVLWKPSSPELPGWDSPWGRGRPGWHIECSAMIETHLGNSIDIHGGGQDLIFPHHENEIAQGTCAHDGELYCQYWMHNGYINVNGEKMSKSLGNFTLVKDLLAKFPGEVVRFALLSAHYRSQLNWSEELLHQAEAALDRFYQALRNLDQVTSAPAEIHPSVLAALNDDLNTPEAISALHGLAHQLNKSKTVEQQAQLKGQLLGSAQLLGLLQQNPQDWFQKAADSALDSAAIEQLIEERIAAKKAKNFARADEIRSHLEANQVLLEDTREGTRWHRKK